MCNVKSQCSAVLHSNFFLLIFIKKTSYVIRCKIQNTGPQITGKGLTHCSHHTSLHSTKGLGWMNWEVSNQKGAIQCSRQSKQSYTPTYFRLKNSKSLIALDSQQRELWLSVVPDHNRLDPDVTLKTQTRSPKLWYECVSQLNASSHHAKVCLFLALQKSSDHPICQWLWLADQSLMFWLARFSILSALSAHHLLVCW